MEPVLSKPVSDASVASDSSNSLATESLGTSDRQKLEEWSFDQVWKLQEQFRHIKYYVQSCTQTYYTRDLPDECSGAISHKSGRCPKYVMYFFQTSLILLRLPLHFGLLLQGEGRNPIKLNVKTFLFSRSISGTQRCNGRKSRLSKLLSFVPNQRLPYKLVEIDKEMDILFLRFLIFTF